MRNHHGVRWMSVLLCLVMLMPAWNAAADPLSEGVTAYYVVEKENVCFRDGAGSNYDTIAHFPIYTVVQGVTESIGTDRQVWYMVEADVELYGMGTVRRTGFVRNDMVRVMTGVEVQSYLQNGGLFMGGTNNTENSTGGNTTVYTGAGAPATGYEIVQVDGSAYLRGGSTTQATLLAKLPNGTMVRYLGSEMGSEGVAWHRVSYFEVEGYIRSDLMRAATEYEVRAGGGALPTPTPAPTAPLPNAPTYETVNATGNVYLRARASTEGNSLAALPGGTVVYYIDWEQGRDGFVWHQVRAGSLVGFVRGDLLRASTNAEILAVGGATPMPTPPPTPAPTSTPPMTHEVVKAFGNVYMRGGPSTRDEKVGNVPGGALVKYQDWTRGTDDMIWHRVQYGAANGFIRSDLLRAATSQEMASAGVGPTPKPTFDPSGKTAYYVLREASYMYYDASAQGIPIGAVPQGQVVEMYATQVATDGSGVWAGIAYQAIRGYVPMNILRAATAVDLGGTSTSAPGGSTTRNYFIVLQNSYLQSSATNTSEMVYAVAAGKLVEVLRSGIGTDGFTPWGQVQCGGYTGYLPMQTMRKATDAEIQAGGGSTATQPPSTGGNANYRVTLDSSYLYDQTAENSAIRYAVPAGKLVEVLRSGAGADNTPWVEVKYGGYTGYMPERLLRQATHAELQAGGIVTPTPTSGAQAIYWVVNVQGNAYMRQAPNTASTALTKVAGGTVLPQKEKTQGVDGYTWMQLTHAQWVGYIRSDLLRAATVSEIVAAGYPPPSAGATPTPAPTSGGNNPVNTMLAVRGSGTNLRTGMGTSFGMVCKLRRDQVLTVLGTGTGADGLLWYRVTADGQTGNVRGDLLRELTAAEKALYGQNSGGGSTGGTTSYRVLTVGSTGEDVLKMQQKLKETGYLQVTSVTNYYGTLTRDAVTNFQRNNGLYADGIATVETQHKLYGTAPSTGGGGNTGGGSVEMADWFGSNIRSQLESQRIFTVIDVATRKSFQVRFFNGKQHADVEPVTKADTAVMMSGTGGDRIFGSYRRPVWVQVNGHTYAASMYAVAHGEEQAIKDNDFEGVCCIHFLNSTTHVDPNSPNAEHQASIQKAYEAGKKK